MATTSRGIYIAGKFNERMIVKELQNKIVSTKSHYHVTHDWTTHNPSVSTKTPAEFSDDASRDLVGIAEADVFVALMTDPKYAYRGTFTELGMALALKKKIIVVTPLLPLNALLVDFQKCSFLYLPQITIVGTEAELLALL